MHYETSPYTKISADELNTWHVLANVDLIPEVGEWK